MAGGYREYADALACLQACRRDAYVKLHGICITAMLPVDSESNLKTEINYFGDMCAVNRVDETRFVIPLYDNYYTLLDVIGEDHEDPLPLECITMTSDHWPRDTLIGLPIVEGDSLETRWWRVISHEQKHIDVAYDKRIKVVPARDSYIEGVV